MSIFFFFSFFEKFLRFSLSSESTAAFKLVCVDKSHFDVPDFSSTGPVAFPSVETGAIIC